MGLGAALVYFAKVPCPGRVKTRLTPPLRPAEASALYGAFLSEILQPVAGVSVFAFAWPPEELAALRQYAHADVDLRAQRGEDLFERVEACFAELFDAGYGPVVVRNTDSPDLPPARVAEAVREAAADAVVLGPDQGGGYYLVGLGAPCPGLFVGLGEGGAGVLGRTRDRASELGRRVVTLATEPDVDTFDDLVALWRTRGR